MIFRSSPRISRRCARLELVEGRPTYLLGHSMGGEIALDYAIDHQDVLAALVLSAPAVLPGDDISPILMKVAKVIGKVVPGCPDRSSARASISRDPAVVKAYDEDPLELPRRPPPPASAARCCGPWTPSRPGSRHSSSRCW